MNHCRRRLMICPTLWMAIVSTAQRAWAAAAPVDEPLDASLREAVHTLPVPGTGASIVVTSFRPGGEGPFPWIMLSHGTGPSHDTNRNIGRYRHADLAREWTRRSYAVLVPVRRGYGASGGARLADSYGSCAKPDFHHAGEEAARDLLATLAWARTQRDLDPTRWMLVGQSSGGFASIYTASKRPQGLVAVLAFSPGRGGDPVRRRYEPCASDRLAAQFAAVAPEIRVPVLWFYAQNDQYIGTNAQRLWFDSFRRAGGRGQLIVVEPFRENLGHGVFPSAKGVPLWTGAVKEFFKAQDVQMPF